MPAFAVKNLPGSIITLQPNSPSFSDNNFPYFFTSIGVSFSLYFTPRPPPTSIISIL